MIQTNSLLNRVILKSAGNRKKLIKREWIENRTCLLAALFKSCKVWCKRRRVTWKTPLKAAKNWKKFTRARKNWHDIETTCYSGSKGLPLAESQMKFTITAAISCILTPMTRLFTLISEKCRRKSNRHSFNRRWYPSLLVDFSTEWRGNWKVIDPQTVYTL